MEAVGTPTPTVAVVVVNLNGAEHLRPCLDSVAQLDYPRGLVETFVVDNGSTDGSRELLEREYTGVTVLQQERNVGFAQAVDTAAEATSAHCLALLNNDMRVDHGWLRELVAAYRPADGADCVGGVILDWEGERVQFADGIVNFHGAAAQVPFGEPLERVELVDGRALPFACGGAMLIGRELFLKLGGFDPAFFAYFEDVDLGWRLWLSGYEVRLAAKARSFHRHHATGSALPIEQRITLYERNWLLTVLKNVGDEHLHRILAASLLLLVERARAESGSDGARYEVGGAPAGETEPVRRTAVARLHAVSDVVRDLDGVLERRRVVQARRRRPDSEVFRLFGRPLFPASENAAYLEAMVRITDALGLEELFTERRATRLLVVPGEDERLRLVAEAALRLVPTTVASPGESAAALAERVAEADVVLVNGCADEAAALVGAVRGLLIVDVDQGVPSERVLEAADVITFGSDDRRDGLDTGRPAYVVTPESLDTLRKLVEEPWRWRSAERPPLPEPALALLAQWRRTYGVSQPPLRQLARAAWRLVPEPARRRLRR